MPRLVLKANQIDAEAVVAEQLRVPRPPLLPGVLVISCEAGPDSQTDPMIQPRPAYDKRCGSGRFRFGRQLWNVREHGKESR
jgi:hypothetical protein